MSGVFPSLPAKKIRLGWDGMAVTCDKTTAEGAGQERGGEGDQVFQFGAL